MSGVFVAPAPTASFVAPAAVTDAPTTAVRLTAPSRSTSTASGPTFQPTGEQHTIIDAFRTGANLVVEAGAGTGKSSTMLLLANVDPGRRGLYVAYNKVIADAAARKFPAGVDCRTAHSLAYRAVGQRYAHRIARMGGGGSRLPARDVADLIGVRSNVIGSSYFTATALARVAETTVATFCASADDTITAKHVAAPITVDETHLEEFAATVVPAAKAMWDDLRDPAGRLYFTDDHYLKLWQLQRPRLSVDYIMLDEAQDASPVIEAVIAAQGHAQLAYVGDRSQAIYRWRGAVDAMSNFAGERHQLTRSFRFGPPIAAEANRWLELLGADLRITGHDPITSTLGPDPAATAILCRTNGGAFSQVMAELGRGRRVALVGGGVEVRRFAYAARSLMNGQGCDLPDLAAFRTWSQLRAYVNEEHSGADLKMLVNLVDRYGAGTLIDTVKRLSPAEAAQVTISTAHRAKGTEFPSVRIGDDFTAPDDGDPAAPDELMLSYVAVTRAQHRLDVGSLSWPRTGSFDADGAWSTNTALITSPKEYL
ncbi:MAG TPA: UvrD-helicase domain-containing protein [Micromonosporaceae bacterium]|nr:UvrD-helicase domain-containing protein [Micromonosporaceae bacterium]